MPMLPPLLAPLLLILAALLPPLRSPARAELAALGALALAAVAALAVILSGPLTASVGSGPFLLALRLDGLGAVMTVLVTFVGWVVLRYARTYLRGEAGQGTFTATTLATLAAVLVLVSAGSLLMLLAAFAAVGAGIRRLLLFYPARPAAQRAARKMRLVARAGDAALVLAAIPLFAAYGTAEIAAMRGTPAPFAALWAAGFLALAAALKSAQFPAHGWLTEVMEAPTPVSALLHAGVINAGGFLLLRFAPVMEAAPGAMAALAMLGGFTALIGGIVMLTQPVVKTALAWSTVAQMGFLILQCGLGLWALALLHIVAHSLYKAHAFLAAGGAVAAVASARRPGPVAVPGIAGVARAFAVALLLYGAVALAFTLLFGPKAPQMLALGAILVFGVAYLLAQGLADTAPAELTRRTALWSVVATLAYFGFQAGAAALMAGTLPEPPAAGPLEWALIVLAVLSFGAVAVAQALFPHWAHHPASAGLRVHLANGLYANALFDRLTGGFRTPARH